MLLRCETDEEPSRVNFDKISSLKPVFKKEGFITVANASSLNDGGAAVIVMSEAKAKTFGLTPLVRIVGHAESSQEPQWYTTAPVNAIKAVLEKTSLSIQNIDIFEINEEKFGLKLCPCRLRDGSKERDMELICPCNFFKQDVWREQKRCWCGLFVKKV